MAEEYNIGRRKMTTYQRRLAAASEKDPTEAAMVGSVVREMAWVIDWLRTGHQPGLSRGTDRRGVYRSNRRVVLDEDLFPSLQEPPRKRFELSDDERNEALSVIRTISQREMTCLQLHLVDGLSLGKIAETLKLSKRTVQDYVDRAKKKILTARTG
ncbi:LuxR C-terminal-related transcriptional regulator [Cohnella nanjingensis]|uniref:HTH luxR-type domain-containing protein n=1 Tax=Cohnella nanjingensis TaxID=1387779 RepID=A0A7X0RQD8_9BACL|nr:LuxR C-terminal-related transcriptional regulator [Cohnella nanjingensis]MBB6670500.1 hypothetical protein [Cohnella nanjingensis]